MKNLRVARTLGTVWLVALAVALGVTGTYSFSLTLVLAIGLTAALDRAWSA